MAYDLESIHGFHKVNNVKARELLQPYISVDGYYLLRPSADAKGGVLCTICVTNRNKLMNYRMVRDPGSGMFYIHNHTQFPAINLLISHYQTSPINTEVNTRLLYPVGEPPQQQSSEAEDAYVIMEKQNPMSPVRTISGSSVSTGSSGIPGLFSYLPKSEINTVMAPFLGTNGYYLLRPSSTSEGQLTLAVSYKKSVLNFKINFEAGKYFISPKNKFSSVQDLLFHFNSHPIRSKKAGNDKILLLYPVPVDEEKEQLYEEVKQQRAAKHQASSSSVLAPGWTEHWHNQYNRTYYYNASTGESVWEKPVATPVKRTPPPLPDKSPSTSRPARMKDRPLPTVPGTSSGETPGEQPGKSRKPSVKYSKQPLPNTPGSSQTLPNRRTSMAERELPPLPPKDDNKRTNPPLPPKEDSGGASRPPLPIPGRDSRKSLPPLPPKEDSRAATLPKKNQPPLPAKDRPPLPPKVEEPAPVQTTAPAQSRPKKKRVVEYEDTVPLHQAEAKFKPKTPPPLPEKDSTPVAPPPPAVTAPAPPPPPAIGASPVMPRSHTVSNPSPQSSPGSGRPFTAGDLASQKHLLKKRADTVVAEPKREPASGLASVFANAIDTRRKAMVDSESEESDFDDAEEEDWD